MSAKTPPAPAPGQGASAGVPHLIGQTRGGTNRQGLPLVTSERLPDQGDSCATSRAAGTDGKPSRTAEPNPHPEASEGGGAQEPGSVRAFCSWYLRRRAQRGQPSTTAWQLWWKTVLHSPHLTVVSNSKGKMMAWWWQIWQMKPRWVHRSQW